MPDEQLHNPPTPKRLLLSLLSAPSLEQISARQCTQWGALFAIEAAAMRVALGRMVRAGFLETAARGVYRIGPQGRVLSRAARQWVIAEERIGPWDGRWLVVHVAHLGRRDRTALRARERALRLVGFATGPSGLWLRPGNFRESPEQTRERLCELGLDETAVLLRADRVLRAEELEAVRWPTRELARRYALHTDCMQASMQRLPSLDVAQAARESFLVGEAVIRQINSDPLLPDAMVDASGRRQMHATMLAYDAVGRRAWERFQDSDGASIQPAAQQSNEDLLT
jgi:phenylacetic acid degradation operon negative regulatory protein